MRLYIAVVLWFAICAMLAGGIGASEPVSVGVCAAFFMYVYIKENETS